MHPGFVHDLNTVFAAHVEWVRGLVHDLNTVFVFHVKWVGGLVHDLSIVFVGRPGRNVGRQDGMLSPWTTGKIQV